MICLIFAGAVLTEDQPQAVPTFHCLGLYWSPEDGSVENTCDVRYRPVGDAAWKEALHPWFDARSSGELPAEHHRQYRGSIVNLSPDTEYEIELSLPQTGRRCSLRARTWAEVVPVGKTVEVTDDDSPLIVDQSGSPDGYTLYTHPQNSATATIDVANRHAQCVEIRASHVILRGLTLTGAQQHGIRLFEGCHDVVIEGCDISGWGRIAEDGWGHDLDSAVYSRAQDLARVVLQRNRIHHPRSDSNTWKENRPRPGKRESYHPEGPQAIYFANSQGNHVIRYNSVWSDEDHQYNDVFGGASNFSFRGFPNRDSDLYGNLLSRCWDDAIESEGANCNVRIWGNYTTDCFVSIACASTSIGPLYVWRNVSGAMREAPGVPSSGFLKTSDKTGGGKIFVFHNTIFQPARLGLGWGGPMVNVTSRNNILNVTHDAIRKQASDPLGDYDYDLFTGQSRILDEREKHGIRGEPIYLEGCGIKDGKGRFELSRTSPGYDAAQRLANFNDGCTDGAPDIGAHEASTPDMEFGADAYTQQ
ncbi:MAG: right-handed parallel beta-helix repeat-containing protein [Phycisphaerae bacterium]|nr:right-handed parallel beta-helix repeat-containing protein [Phycisphaerae bacterium]